VRNRRRSVESTDVTIRDVLTRIPAQWWSLAIPNHCLSPFCDETILPELMEVHPRETHDAATPCDFFSATHTHLAGCRVLFASNPAQSILLKNGCSAISSKSFVDPSLSKIFALTKFVGHCLGAITPGNPSFPFRNNPVISK
jgi:hypothetical protein